MDKVLVLMSTYNGGKYLVSQIESILNQVDVEVYLMIRDDGSTDETIKLIEDIRHQYPEKIEFVRGINVGVKASFLELLKNSSDRYDYYAFSDQDDIWLPSKLSAGCRQLNGLTDKNPGLYCSKTQLVDQDLNYMKLWPPTPQKKLSIHNALVENVAVGCTIIMNRSARALIKSLFPDPENIIMHDWWIYLCISTFGQVIFDPTPHILYRQHTNNLVGGEHSFYRKWKKKAISFLANNNNNIRQLQAVEFYRIITKNNLEIKERRVVENLVHYGEFNFLRKALFTLNPGVYRQSKVESFFLRLIIIRSKL